MLSHPNGGINSRQLNCAYSTRDAFSAILEPFTCVQPYRQLNKKWVFEKILPSPICCLSRVIRAAVQHAAGKISTNAERRAVPLR